MAHAWLVLIPFLPLAGAVLHGVAATSRDRRAWPALAWATVAASFVGSVWLFLEAIGTGLGPAASEPGGRAVAAIDFRWLAIPEIALRPGLRADALGLFFAMLATGVSLAAHSNALGRGPGKPETGAGVGSLDNAGSTARHLACLQGLTASVLLLLLAADFVTLFAGWQGTALFTALSAGSRRRDPAAVGTGNKAFVLNRIGDIGLVLGIAGVAVLFRTLDLGRIARILHDDSKVEILGINIDLPVLEALARPIPEIGVPVAAGLLAAFVLAAVVRSAQYPLHVWLPEAAAAPSPRSTSAAALYAGAAGTIGGVYLLVRLSFFFHDARHAGGVGILLGAIALIGAVSALASGLAACTARDPRRIVGHLVIGHLGLAMVGIGAGGFASGAFHGATTVVWAGLSFLALAALGRADAKATGAVEDATAGGLDDLDDLAKLGRARRRLPLAAAALAIGALGAAGLPLFGGFFSGVGAVLEARTAFNQELAWAPTAAHALALVGVAALAAASLRLILAAFGRSDTSLETHPSSPFGTKLPLLALAVVSVGIGFVGVPPVLGLGIPSDLFHGWTDDAVSTIGHYARVEPGAARPGEWSSLGLFVLASGLGSVAGVILGRREVAASARTASESVGAAGRALAPAGAGGLLDRLYLVAVLRPLDRLTMAFAYFETRVVERVVTGVGRSVRFFAFLLSRFENGDVQYYGMVLALGVAGLLLFQVLTRF